MNFFWGNLLVLIGFGIGYILDISFGFSYIRNIFGLIFVLFIPGFNIAYLIFNDEDKINELERLLFASLLSIVLVPLSVYVFHLFGGAWFIQKDILLLLLGLWAVSFLSVLIKYGFLRKQLPIFKIAFDKPLALVFLIYFILLSIIFFIYKFLPEADPYGWLITIEKLIKTAEAPIFYNMNYRPFFPLWILSLSHFSHINLYWLFKFILPLFLCLYLIPFYLFASKLTQNKTLLFLASLFPLTVPVIIMETEVIRPQSIIILFLPIVLYFLAKAITIKSYKIWFVIFIISLITLKIHELSLLLLFFSAMSFLVLARHDIKKHYRVSIIIALLSILALYPYIPDIGLFYRIFNWLKFGWALNPHTIFRLWFISNYINIDGYQMGWPGVQAVYYYIYNLGIFIPIVLAAYLVLKNKTTKILYTGYSLFPILLSVLVFFALAEILPRFNIYFLPDRAWLFLTISLIFLMPLLLINIQHNLSNLFVRIIFIITILISLGGSCYIAYIKQGRVSNNEYQASLFLKDKTPKESAVVSQGSNGPLITYFGQRYLVNIPDDIFSKEAPLTVTLNGLRDVPEYISNKRILEEEKEQILKETESQTTSFSQVVSSNQMQELLKQEKENRQKLAEINKDLLHIQKEGLDQPRPIYILYSFDKFKNIYRIREWWLKVNYYDADLSKFDNPKYFEKVFDNQAVKIWKFKEE